MSYTHHNSISVTGSGGYAVGSKVDGETVVIDTGGGVTCSGALTTSSGAVVSDDNSNITFTYVWNTTATQSWYCSTPVAGNVSHGYLTHQVAAATTGKIEVLNGTAGAAILTFPNSVGTVGSVQTVAATGSETAFTAGQCIKVTMTATATSVDETFSSVCIVMDRT